MCWKARFSSNSKAKSRIRLKAGEAFWEPGFDVVHYQAANLRTDIASKFVVFMLCAPDVSMMTFLDEEEIAAREHLRYQSSERHT